MRIFLSIRIALAFIFLSISINAQISQNVSLFGSLDPEPIHYAGTWSYIDSSGNEYALLGAYTGTSIISIDDSNNIYEADFIVGPSSNWREFTVIGNYAYVVSEGTGPLAGMQVLDLSPLPDSVVLITTFDSTFTRAHMIQKNIGEDSAYVYVAGSQAQQGVCIIDVSDPYKPVQIGKYAPYYIHDCHVRGDTMYAAAIYEGQFDVVDISNKQSPQLTAQIIYPDPFPHSAWTTKNHRYLITTDEVDSLPARIWDVSDLSNIVEVAQYTGNYESLVHNPYVREDFAFFSHNTEGLRVVDIAHPDLPVEVGYYDTWLGASGGFQGLWSACPFFPSGKIVGGNRHDGLYIWKFNDTRAGRIYGEVVDSITGNPIVGATVEFDVLDTLLTNNLGQYKVGALPDSGNGYYLRASALGYFSKTISNITLNGGDSLWHRIELASLASAYGGVPFPEFTLNISPNPANEEINIRLPKYINERVTAKIINAEGKMVLDLGILSHEKRKVDIKYFPAGNYFIIFETESGGSRSGKKFIKNP